MTDQATKDIVDAPDDDDIFYIDLKNVILHLQCYFL